MSFLDRCCWYCAAGENPHPIIAVRKKTPFEYKVFLVCPSCEMPSCALLKSLAVVEEAEASIIEREGKIQDGAWRVIAMWPPVERAKTAVPADSRRNEPAEKAYRPALDIARRENFNDVGRARMVNHETPAAQDRALSVRPGRLTLRQFSELLIAEPHRRKA